MDITDAARMPAIGEPFFSELQAAMDRTPAMNIEELQRGLAQAAAGQRGQADPALDRP